MRWLFSALAPAGTGARLTTLIFHRVLPAPDPLFPEEMHAQLFASICGWLREWFNVLPLDTACRRLAEQALPPRALAITFDDGYADNHDVAVPILREYGLHATFFVASGFLDGGRMWNDTLIESVRRTRLGALNLHGLGLEGLERIAVETLTQKRAAVDQLISACRYLPAAQRDEAVRAVAKAAGAGLPSELMMTSDQVRSLVAQGMGLGGHTVSHPILAVLPEAEALREIVAGKSQLESVAQVPLKLFAYPNGRPTRDYTGEHSKMVQEAGFDAAVSTAWGVSNHLSDRFQLPRFTPWDRSRIAFGLRLARNLSTGRAAATS